MRSPGFTLIEVMIVLVIVGIMSALATVSINAPSYSKFSVGAEQFAATFSTLSDEAIYTSSVITCDLGKNSISCNRYKDSEWSPIDIRQMISWSWPSGFIVKQVLINGIAIREDEQIKFLPSGDNDILSVEISNGEYTAWIDADRAGRYKVSS